MTKNGKTVLGLAVVAVVAVLAFALLTAPDQRSGNEKLGDAIGKLDDGIDDAAREFEDRTPAERISDEVDDATDGDRN